MPTSQNIRDFYENLYKTSHKRNPAFQIYDSLRAENIHNLAQNSHDPVLIVGCGSNRDYTIISSEKNVFAFDLSFEAVYNAKAAKAGNISLFTGDAINIPIKDNTFRLVICSEVLEHIPDIRSAIAELRRVMRQDGVLIVSSPNWHSWFGLARWLSEKIARKTIHSDNQPYDDWKTWDKYKAELSPEFEVLQTIGIWYLPPLHFREYGLPESITGFIYTIFSPFERFLSKRFPGHGHLIMLKCKPR